MQSWACRSYYFTTVFLLLVWGQEGHETRPEDNVMRMALGQLHLESAIRRLPRARIDARARQSNTLRRAFLAQKASTADSTETTASIAATLFPSLPACRSSSRAPTEELQPLPSSSLSSPRRRGGAPAAAAASDEVSSYQTLRNVLATVGAL